MRAWTKSGPSMGAIGSGPWKLRHDTSEMLERGACRPKKKLVHGDTTIARMGYCKATET